MNWKGRYWMWGLLGLFLLMVGVGAWGIFYKIDVDKPSLTQLRVFIQYVAVILGSIGVIIALLNYRRKSGIDISSFYQIAQANCQGGYLSIVANIWLKNNKDKAVVVFSVYLKYQGKKIFLKRMNHKPLIIPPYGAVILNTFDYEEDVPSYMYQNKTYTPKEYGTEQALDIFSNRELLNIISNAVETQQNKGVYLRTFTGDFYAKSTQNVLATLSDNDNDIYFREIF